MTKNTAQTLQQIFGPLFGEIQVSPTLESTVPVGSYEGETSFILRAQVPGLKAEEVAVSFTEGVLSLKAEKPFSVPEGFKEIRAEETDLLLNRKFKFSSPVDGDNITATLVDGVLTVTVPKVQAELPKKIQINK